jgi:hypothetical protein
MGSTLVVATRAGNLARPLQRRYPSNPGDLTVLERRGNLAQKWRELRLTQTERRREPSYQYNQQGGCDCPLADPSTVLATGPEVADLVDATAPEVADLVDATAHPRHAEPTARTAARGLLGRVRGREQGLKRVPQPS